MDIIKMSLGTIGTNCYILISRGNKCAVIDPGAQPEKIIAELEERKLTLSYILITHGHHDHIGGVKKLAEKYTEAKIHIGKNDLEMLTDTKKSLALMRYGKADDFIIDRAEAVEDGAEITLDELSVRVVETPGHTKGGVCYLCRDVIFSGDTLFYGDVGRCDLYGGDYDVLKASLKKLAGLEGDYKVHPGHGGSTSLEFERNHNRYIAEALE